ncbi:ABC transporter ATP-binding protein [Sporichthya polymorpha]|uniref:ABC transporter ATP-binding protein n=1 Tax=Sporichthya polymorpha TaxID=35751 RepID=UPI00036831A5|nr:ABC transporter ATP-binding protein [Sporichthya polymorpha]
MAARKRKPTPLIEVRNVGIRFRTNRQRPFRTRVRESFTADGRRARRDRGPDEFWALRDVSFTVADGEAVGLVGRNGHGKSTLLKLIAGVMIPDEGAVKVRGPVAPMIEVTGGFVGDLTVRDNIWLAAGLKGLTKRQIAARFDDIVEWAEIGHRLDTPLRHLSSGMKAKVGFSVITSIDRPIVLVDEVLSVGDRAFRQKCFNRMEELRNSGKTIVLVSHQESQIERFCKRGLYLQHGRLVHDGPVKEVLAHYIADVEKAVDEEAEREREAMARRARRDARRARLEAETAGEKPAATKPAGGKPAEPTPAETKPAEPKVVPAQGSAPEPPEAAAPGEEQLTFDVQVEEQPAGEPGRAENSRTDS